MSHNRAPRAELLRVVLLEGEDPKVYDAQTGEDVQRRCRSITIRPAQEASAEMFDVDTAGHIVLDDEKKAPSSYTARVLSIRAEGVWSRR